MQITVSLNQCSTDILDYLCRVLKTDCCYYAPGTWFYEAVVKLDIKELEIVFTNASNRFSEQHISQIINALLRVSVEWQKEGKILRVVMYGGEVDV